MALFTQSFNPYKLTRLTTSGAAMFVFDCNNLAYRALHSHKEMTFEGAPSGHVFGFVKILMTALAIASRVRVVPVFVWDGYAKHKFELYPEYKANRGRRVPPSMKEIMSGIHAPVIDIDPMDDIVPVLRCLPGYHAHDPDQEADDVIASFIHRTRLSDEKHKRTRRPVRIYSGDRDMAQLLNPDTVQVPDNKRRNLITHKNVSHAVLPETVADLVSLSPRHVCLVKAVLGDTSDNIKGVPRIRKKAVAPIIQASSGTFRSFVHTVQTMGQYHLSKKESEKLTSDTGLETIKRNLRLITLDRRLPVRAVWVQGNKKRLVELVVGKFGCKSLKDDINQRF